MGSHAPQRMLVLGFRDTAYAVLASDLVAIDKDGCDARLALDAPVLELADHLDGADGGPLDPVRLIVKFGRRRYAFRAKAHIALVEATGLVRLPRLVRHAGCADWVRGLAFVGAADVDDDRCPPPIVWIDLGRLAFAHR